MKFVGASFFKVSATASTDIAGFDKITGGNLPRGRTTLLTGRPGPGKTILGQQFLVHGAQEREKPGISGASPATDRL